MPSRDLTDVTLVSEDHDEDEDEDDDDVIIVEVSDDL